MMEFKEELRMIKKGANPQIWDGGTSFWSDPCLEYLLSQYISILKKLLLVFWGCSFYQYLHILLGKIIFHGVDVKISFV